MRTLLLLLLLPLLACSCRTHNFPEATLENAAQVAEQAQIDEIRVMSKTLILKFQKQRSDLENILEREDLTPEDRKRVPRAMYDIESCEDGIIERLETLDVLEKRLYE